MHPEIVNAVPAFLQYGALGLCALLLGAWFWSVTRFVKVTDKALDVIPTLTNAVHDLRTEVGEVAETSTKIHERLLQWDCPFCDKSPTGHKEPPACVTA